MKNLALATLALTTVALTGCSAFQQSTAAPQLPMSAIHGSVYGGRQPVANATIQIYQSGTGAYGAGATGLLATLASTDATGHFNITGNYTCTSGTQLYLVAVGGQPTPSVTNNASILMAGLGSCDFVHTGIPVQMNEATTVATVWALAPFLNGTLGTSAVVNQVGPVTTAGINVGSPNAANLADAFADINTLVDISTGYAGGPGLGANVSVPKDEIYALSNILAGCIDGDGTQAGCTQLYSYATPPGGTAPADTFAAALDIARNPGNNAAALLTLSMPTAPYATQLAQVSDWTIGITYTGSGLGSPSAVAVDASGNIWVTNSATNTVSEFTHTGTALSGASGFTDGALNAPSAIAIDVAGNAWITNAGNSTLTELASDGTNTAGSPYSGGGLSVPASIAFDGSGSAWIANHGANTVSAFSSTGAALSGPSGYAGTGASSPVGVAINPR